MFKNKNTSLLEQYSNKENIIFKNKNDKGTLLLLEKNEENTQILKTIGFDNYISKVEKEVHLKNSKNVLTELYNKPAYLGNEIKKLCNDYDLVITKVSNYKGAPFKDLPQIIQSFIDDNSEDVVIPEKIKSEKVYYDGYSLDEKQRDKEFPYEDSDGKYKRETIIIPEKIVKKSKIKTGYSNWFVMVPRESVLKFTNNTCCTLFYRDNDDSGDISVNDVFTEVYSWGKSYSNIRKYNYFLKSIDFKKENIGLRTLDKDNADNFGFFVVVLTLILLSTILYFISFKITVFIQIILFIFMYFAIKKPSKNYLKLWKL